MTNEQRSLLKLARQRRICECDGGPYVSTAISVHRRRRSLAAFVSANEATKRPMNLRLLAIGLTIRLVSCNETTFGTVRSQKNQFGTRLGTIRIVQRTKKLSKIRTIAHRSAGSVEGQYLTRRSPASRTSALGMRAYPIILYQKKERLPPPDL
ncbi:hypothetical protein EVAR_20168_1 [Eumeta japonica]|uniref:Uncharacterized protein n=1 Tax=Eumeta variegata TaxID=151549 RepID=A0A4C1UU65_EUMVA|nr:hypothetical protein EVAR_20168_1 [Eumeta japonica]